MGIDDELRRAGRQLVDHSRAALTPDELRGALRRRRRVRLVVPVAAVVVLVGVLWWPGGRESDTSIDTVDNSSTSTTSSSVELGPARIESGHGPTTVVASDGTPLISLEGQDLTPKEDGLAFAVMDEIMGTGTGAGSTASAALAEAGLSGRFDKALAQLGDAGLVIETTLDTEALDAAASAVEAGHLPEQLSAALWSIDPDDGATLAVSGAYPVLELSAGGAIRPAMMAVALENGVAPSDRFANPPSLTIKVDGFDWEVHNPEDRGSEPVTLGEALVLGANTPWVGLVADGRIDQDFYGEVVDRFGFRHLQPDVSSMVLGTFETSLAEVAHMTAAFATTGTAPEVHLVNRVHTRDGKSIFDRSELSTEPAPPVVQPGTRDAVRSAMARAMCCGPAKVAELGDPIEQIGIAATYPGVYVNAWFTGSTPALTTVVWVGDLEQRTDPTSRAVTAPESIWANYTTAVTDDVPARFPQ